jgi:hypothetical protein
VGQPGLCGGTGLFEHGYSFAEQSFLANAGDEAILGFELAPGRKGIEDCGAELFDTVAGEGGNGMLAGLDVEAG